MASCPRCGDTGRLADHPCGCSAGAAGRAAIRADRREREQERRLQKARGTRRTASVALTAAVCRWMFIEWQLGQRQNIRQSRGKRTIIAASEALARAARREALVEFAIRGQDSARRLWRYERDHHRRIAAMLAAPAPGPRRLGDVLQEALAKLPCPECGSEPVAAGAVIGNACAARGAPSSPSSSAPGGPAHEEAARVSQPRAASSLLLPILLAAALSGCGPDAPTEWTIQGTPPPHTDLALDVGRDMAPCPVERWGGWLSFVEQPAICGSYPDLPANGCTWLEDDGAHVWVVVLEGEDALDTALLHELGHVAFGECGLPHSDHPAAFWRWISTAYMELLRRERLPS